MKKTVVLMLLFSVSWLWGQGQTIRISVKQVYLPVRVFEKGEAASGLQVDNFRVWEEFKNEQTKNVRVEQKVESVHAYRDVALAIGAMLDSSGSMSPAFSHGQVMASDKLDIARNACKSFFQAIFREGQDRGLISEFYFNPAYFPPGSRKRVDATSLRVRQDWTSHLQEILQGVEGIKRPGGATPLRNAVFELTEGYFAGLDGQFLRVLVVLSDGGDAGDPKVGGTLINSHRLTEVVAQLENRQVLVFAIGTFKKTWPNDADSKSRDILEIMAEATGGQAFFEDDLSKLADVFRKVGEMIRDVHFLSYVPSHDELEGARKISVEVGDWDEQKKWHKRKMTVFHRQGYFYQP